jgi:hypothetical protein
MTSKRIARSAAGNLVKVDTPEFLSLVGKPANQRPFQIIRSARPAKAKRGEDAVLMITFPDDYTEEDAAAALESFGMEGYTLVVEETLCYAYRSDLQSVAKVQELKPTTVRLTSDGVTAHIDPAQYQPKSGSEGTGIGVCRYEFTKTTFDNDKIIAWGNQNGVDISVDAIENSSSDVISVSRAQLTEGTEVRRMELEAGVTAVIVRTDGMQIIDGAIKIPDGFVAVVNEAAYGNWGWGQMDFYAASADRAFCEEMEDAAWRLRDVMSNIMFYNQLPLDTRKQLVTRCLQQYGQFISDAMDALPRQVLLLASRADSIKRKDVDMTIDAVKAQQELDKIVAKRAADEKIAQDAADKAAAEKAEIQRAADEKIATDKAAADKATADAVSLTMTRADLDKMIADAVAKATTAAPAVTTETAVRSEATTTTTTTPATAEAPVAITRADLEALLAAAVAPLAEKVGRLEGTTIVRSADGNETAAVTATEKRSVFRGIFNNLTGTPE